MPSPARNLNTLRLAPLTVCLLGSGALAQDDGSAGAAPEPQAQVDGQAPAGEAGAAAEMEAQAAPSAVTPGVEVLARWLRSSSCRIFTTFPVDGQSRFSPSTRGRRHPGWRISLPSFAGAFLSTAAQIEGGEGMSLDVAGVAPGEGDAPASDGAQPVAAPQLTWTQKVGLVKADVPSGPVAGDAATGAPGTAAQPSWTQRVGLVKSPSTSEPTAAGVASFSKKKAADESGGN